MSSRALLVSSTLALALLGLPRTSVTAQDAGPAASVAGTAETSTAAAVTPAPSPAVTSETPDPDPAPAAKDPAVSDAEIAAIMAGSSTNESIQSDAPSLTIYGFADVTLMRAYPSSKSPGGAIAGGRSMFSVGSVNAYLAANLTHGFSSLVEVRFSYMPGGSRQPNLALVKTYADDHNNFGRQERWGGIVLQRVHIDYSYNGLLNVRVGQFLTPYGIWNVDHGSPTIIPATKPFVINGDTFPQRQTGLQVFGSRLWGATTFGYHLTVSNGRGDFENLDMDKNKALGARLFVSTDAIGSLTVGASGYGGKATLDTNYAVEFSSEGAPKIVITTTNQYYELALAADLRWEWKNIHLQSEVLVSQVEYLEAGRPPIRSPMGTTLGLTPDHTAWGAYVLGGYRFPWLSVMPYVVVDWSRGFAPGPGGATSVNGRGMSFTGGLNVRPVPSVVIKGEFTYVKLPDGGPNGDVPLILGQVAWAF